MKIIVPRDGFCKNVLNRKTSDHLVEKVKEKLKGRENLFSTDSSEGYISIRYIGKNQDNSKSILLRLADELNKELVGGLKLFSVCSGYDHYYIVLDGDLEFDGEKERKITYNVGYAKLLALPGRYGYNIVSKLLRPGRVETDLRYLVSFISSKYGFVEDNGSDTSDSLVIDEVFDGDDTDNIMYSIKCSTPEIAEEFAKKWAYTIQRKDMYRYSYLIGSMIDPALMNPNYHGFNRVYRDPSVIIGFIRMARSLRDRGMSYDKSLLPSNAKMWDW